MRDDACPVQWAGRRAVVTLPDHIDASNAGQIREELLSVIYHGAATLIADMTATTLCDRAGVHAVARACQRGAAAGTDLRLVATARAVRRMLAVSGLDQLVSVYPSLDAATAGRQPAVALTLVAGPAAAETNGRRPSRRGGGHRLR